MAASIAARCFERVSGRHRVRSADGWQGSARVDQPADEKDLSGRLVIDCEQAGAIDRELHLLRWWRIADRHTHDHGRGRGGFGAFLVEPEERLVQDVADVQGYGRVRDAR